MKTLRTLQRSPLPLPPLPREARSLALAVIDALLILAVAALILTLALGCAPTAAYGLARRVQGGAAQSLIATEHAWIEYDWARQSAIVEHATSREEARALLAKYRAEEQSIVVALLKDAARAIDTLRHLLDAAEAAQRGDFAGAIAPVAASFAHIAEAFAKFNIGIAPPVSAPAPLAPSSHLPTRRACTCAEVRS